MIPPNVRYITCLTNTNEVIQIPIDLFLSSSNNDTEDESGITTGAGGQIILKKYTSSNAFTGTPIGLLAYDSNGKLISYPLVSQQTIQNPPSSVGSATFEFDGTPYYLPIFTEDGSIGDSDILSNAAKNYSVGGNKPPIFKWDVRGGSINIDKVKLADAYRINGAKVVDLNVTTTHIELGNAVNHTIKLTNLIADSIKVPLLGANLILATDANNLLQSLSAATYPSLLELTYVKGVTSAIQTQLNDINASHWKITGNVVTAERIFGTTSGNFDIQVLRNNVEVGKWITGGLRVPLLNVSGLTASEIVGTDASKNLISLAVATYPSLLELTYLKGVTSGIQTQLNLRSIDTAVVHIAGTETITGAKTFSSDVQIPAIPINATSATSKSYIDNLLTGITWKNEVRVATTVNIVLSGLQTIDGIVGGTFRVLVKNNNNQTENGLYDQQSGAWTRVLDADTASELETATVAVRSGTANRNTQWTCTASGVVLGATNITFGQISGAGTYTNGAGITLTGNVFAIDTAVVVTLTGVQTLSNKTFVAPHLGTPLSGVMTNVTGTAAGLTAGNVTTNANLTGEVTSIGNATTVLNATVIGKILTGYVSGVGTIAATDTILQAIQKLNANDATNANLTGGVTSVGNAATVITNANLTGIVTSVGNATAIADAALSIAKTSGLQTALDSKFTTPSTLTTNYLPKWNGTAFANSQIFDNGTNVGIGTPNPLSRLHLVGNSSSTADEVLLTLSGIGENGKSIDFRNAFGSLAKITGTKLGGGSNADEGIIIFETATNSILSEKVRIDSNGNVGIGTPNPLAKLEVSADILVHGINIGRGGGSVAGNTRVGFESLLSNTTGFENAAYGAYSLKFNTTGYYNVASGAYAMQFNIGGVQNTAFGFRALRMNTTGNNNVAIGVYALQGNTTAGENVAIGISALSLNTIGGTNVAVGSYALRNNITGGNNTSLGHQAGFSATTSNNNTFIGFQSGYSTSTILTVIGVNNTFTGSFSGFSNSTGSNNTFLGLQAGYYNTTGSSSTAVGMNALFVSTGSLNTAVGAAALNNNTTGSQNTAFGYQAGGNVTIGANNTFLGFNSGIGITTGGSNTIIGANVTGLAAALANNIIIADGDGNRRINVDSIGRVGMGTISPYTRLHVLGFRDSEGTILGQLIIESTEAFSTSPQAGVIFRNSHTTGAAAYMGSVRVGKLNVTDGNFSSFMAFDVRNSGAVGFEAMRINNLGNVGIGTTAPDVGATGNKVLTLTGNLTRARFQLQNTDGTSIGSVAGTLQFLANTIDLASITVASVGVVNSGYIGFSTNNAGTIAERMRILPNGNVGIGTTNPDYKLDVLGTGHFTGAVIFDSVPSSLVDATSSNHLVRYSQWIGGASIKYLQTAVKTVALTNITLSGTQTISGVALVSTDRVLLIGQTTAADNGLWIVAAGAWTRATDSDTDAEIRGYIVTVLGGTYANYKYINTNTSAITIGTTAITYSEFSNQTEIDPVFVWWRDTTRTANTFFSAPSGVSGVATFRAIVVADIPTLNQSTTGSAATLTTARNIAITGDIDWNVNFNGGANVTEVGTLATVNANVGTFNNVTVNAKGLVKAASNVAYLTSVSLTTNVTGILPIANGGTGSSTQNFVDLTTAQTIAGVKTFNVDGYFNGVRVGVGGGNSLLNTTIGNIALSSNTTGIHNTSIGRASLQSNTTGEYNTAVGSLSMTLNIAGIYNTAVGYGSLYSNTGSNNVGIGMSAGDNVTTGSNNTFLGYATGRGITTGSGNTVLGYNIIGLSPTLQNTLIIGANGRQDLVADAISFRYNGLLKPGGTAGTTGQFLKANGTQDIWATITTADISNLASYTGFDSRYYTKTESDTLLNTKQASLSGTGFVKIVGTTISYDNTTYMLASLSTRLLPTTYQVGQVLTWDGTNYNFMDIINKPIKVNAFEVVVGNEFGVLESRNEFTFKDGYLKVANKIEAGKNITFGMLSQTTWDAAVTVTGGGQLHLNASKVRIADLGGSTITERVVTVDGNGVLSAKVLTTTGTTSQGLNDVLNISNVALNKGIVFNQTDATIDSTFVHFNFNSTLSGYLTHYQNSSINYIQLRALNTTNIEIISANGNITIAPTLTTANTILGLGVANNRLVLNGTSFALHFGNNAAGVNSWGGNLGTQSVPSNGDVIIFAYNVSLGAFVMRTVNRRTGAYDSAKTYLTID